MSLSVAEVYMLALRKSMIPIVGEAVPHPFDEQVELDSWSWELNYDEDDDSGKGKAKGKDDKPSDPKAKSPLDKNRAQRNDEAILKKIEQIQKNRQQPEEVRNKQVLTELRQAQEANRRNADKDDDADPKKDGDEKTLKFHFTKNVDLASTQLLNCMKAGEVLPRVVLSVYHRSKNAPLTLVVTFKKVVLTGYSLEVDVSETMSDLKESWDAEYEEVDYVYQNRPGSGGVPGVTQGTARIFKMKLKSLF